MRASFYTFRKRKNSTATPSAASPWSPEVNLKERTSLLNPTLIMGSQESAEQINSYNYLQFAGHWYFINSWASVKNDIWECNASLDPLASFKTEILSTTAFVEYDTSGNTWLVDHRLSVEETGTRAQNSQAISLEKTVGEYVVCVTGQGGSVGHFVLSSSGLYRLMDSVRDWSDIHVEDTGNPVSDLFLAFSTWATKALSSGSAPQNIRGAIWVPWRIDGSASQIYLGTYPTGVSGQKITDPLKTGGAILSIPWQASDWRRCSMCHTFELYLPYCGNVGIDAGILAGSSELVIEWSADMRTGDIQYLVFTEDVNGLPIGSYSGCAGVTVPIGVGSVNPIQQVGSVFATAASFAGGDAAGGVIGLAETAKNFLVPNMTSIGTQASGAAAGLRDNEYISITSLFRDTNVSPSSVSAVMGTPTMAVKSLSGLTGFVKTRGASVRIDAGDSVISQVNAMLDGGIYIE